MGMRVCKSRPSPTQTPRMHCLMDSLFGHLEVVGTRFGIVLHLDRQWSRLDVHEFVVDVDRRLRLFFGALIHDPQSYLVPAWRDSRPRVVAGDAIGFEVVAAFLNRTGTTDLGRISLCIVRRENKGAAIKGFTIYRYRPGDRHTLNAATAQQ